MPLFIGLMSGTSMDAVDAALVEFEAGRPRLIAHSSSPYPEALRKALKAAVRQGPSLPVLELGRLDAAVGRQFAQAALGLMHRAGVTARQVTAIGSHGQTLFHEPAAPVPFTLQVGDPNVIAATTGITTVADFRRMDLALGGQGAPLAPAFHAHCFRTPGLERVVVNIGGIANITILPARPEAPVTGFDTGPGNCLLDEWAELNTGAAFDEGGRWARAGTASGALLERLLADEYFTRPPPKSTGRGYFHLEWLHRRLAGMEDLTAADVQATLVQLTAVSVARAIAAYAPATAQVLVCGGGALNPETMRALAAALPAAQVTTTAEEGLAPRCVEAVMFAWLAGCRLQGLPGNLPAVTGARRPAILGGIYQPPP